MLPGSAAPGPLPPSHCCALFVAVLKRNPSVRPAGITGPDDDGFYTYQRPEGKSGEFKWICWLCSGT